MKKSLGPQTLAYPTPVYLVGSYDKEGRANMMNAAWGGICNSMPPSIAVSVRKERYSYEGILDNKAFTINIPNAKLSVAADYFGLASGRHEDKIATAGLTTERATHVNAPLLCECPLVIECRLLNHFELGAHTQMIGEIMDVKVEESCLDANGNPDITKVDPILFAPGNRAYFKVGQEVGKAFAIGKELMPKSS